MNIDIIRNNNDPFARYKMPQLKIATEGKTSNARTVFINLSEVARSLKRCPLMLIKFICNEKGTNYDLKNQKYIIKGVYRQTELQEMVYNFIESYVLCPECSNPETFFVLSKTILMKCYACGSANPIAKDKMYNLIEKEIGESRIENKNYEDKDIKIEDAKNLEDFLAKNQMSKQRGIQALVTHFDISRLAILKNKINSEDLETLVNGIKEFCVKKQEYERLIEYIDFLISNEICKKGDCYKLFMAKCKKLGKEDNGKVKNIVKQYFSK